MNFSKALVSAGALVLAAAPAAGQEFFARDRNTAVQDRFQPQFDPQPLRLGSFLVAPSLELGLEGNDNVFAQPDDTEFDGIGVINPSLDVRSDWGRHEVFGAVDLERRQFFELDSETVTNIQGNAGGRLDVTNDFSVTGEFFGAQLTESRRNISVLDGFAEPVDFSTVGGRVQAEYQRARFQARLMYEVQDRDFDDVEQPDGAAIDQDFRDRVRQAVEGRLSYAVTRDVAVFGQAEYFQRDFDLPSIIDGEAVSRDSDGYAIEAGVDFELSAFLRGDLAVGFFEDNREDPAFADVDGVSVDGQVQWFPTQLTTVTASGFSRSVDAGLVAAASTLEAGGLLRVDHELRRNVILFASVGVTETNFEDDDRDDTFFDVGVGGTYKVSPRLHLNAFYRYFDRGSSFDPADFNQNTFGVSISLFL